MLLNIIVWIVFGALAGWIASIIMKRNAHMGAMANVVVGIVGAFIGGFLMNLVRAQAQAAIWQEKGQEVTEAISRSKDSIIQAVSQSKDRVGEAVGPN